jgi:hypothetical protein
MLDPYLCAGARQRGPAIVERPLAAQPRHRGVDLVVCEFAFGEASAQLGLGELASGKQSQRRDIRPIRVVCHWRFRA